ncbi:hypothetical protein MKZ38_000329 [Zalerion maritima]|uniref:Uncharacterized protein n=1 Tax=Zalerion maritima TaxID=339359 RepID=A0AAD5RFS4_9PEZI|nr:hypothetical protein MKZ38_000329 [Zalerion maritima]
MSSGPRPYSFSDINWAFIGQQPRGFQPTAGFLRNLGFQNVSDAQGDPSEPGRYADMAEDVASKATMIGERYRNIVCIWGEHYGFFMQEYEMLGGAFRKLVLQSAWKDAIADLQLDSSGGEPEDMPDHPRGYLEAFVAHLQSGKHRAIKKFVDIQSNPQSQTTSTARRNARRRGDRVAQLLGHRGWVSLEDEGQICDILFSDLNMESLSQLPQFLHFINERARCTPTDFLKHDRKFVDLYLEVSENNAAVQLRPGKAIWSNDPSELERLYMMGKLSHNEMSPQSRDSLESAEKIQTLVLADSYSPSQGFGWGAEMAYWEGNLTMDRQRFIYSFIQNIFFHLQRFRKVHPDFHNCGYLKPTERIAPDGRDRADEDWWWENWRFLTPKAHHFAGVKLGSKNPAEKKRKRMLDEEKEDYNGTTMSWKKARISKIFDELQDLEQSDPDASCNAGYDWQKSHEEAYAAYRTSTPDDWPSIAESLRQHCNMLQAQKTTMLKRRMGSMYGLVYYVDAYAQSHWRTVEDRVMDDPTLDPLQDPNPWQGERGEESWRKISSIHLIRDTAWSMQFVHHVENYVTELETLFQTESEAPSNLAKPRLVPANATSFGPASKTEASLFKLWYLLWIGMMEYRRRLFLVGRYAAMDEYTCGASLRRLFKRAKAYKAYDNIEEGTLQVKNKAELAKLTFATSWDRQEAGYYANLFEIWSNSVNFRAFGYENAVKALFTLNARLDQREDIEAEHEHEDYEPGGRAKSRVGHFADGQIQPRLDGKIRLTPSILAPHDDDLRMLRRIVEMMVFIERIVRPQVLYRELWNGQSFGDDGTKERYAGLAKEWMKNPMEVLDQIASTQTGDQHTAWTDPVLDLRTDPWIHWSEFIRNTVGDPERVPPAASKGDDGPGLDQDSETLLSLRKATRAMALSTWYKVLMDIEKRWHVADKASRPNFTLCFEKLFGIPREVLELPPQRAVDLYLSSKARESARSELPNEVLDMLGLQRRPIEWGSPATKRLRWSISPSKGQQVVGRYGPSCAHLSDGGMDGDPCPSNASERSSQLSGTNTPRTSRRLDDTTGSSPRRPLRTHGPPSIRFSSTSGKKKIRKARWPALHILEHELPFHGGPDIGHGAGQVQGEGAIEGEGAEGVEEGLVTDYQWKPPRPRIYLRGDSYDVACALFPISARWERKTPQVDLNNFFINLGFTVTISSKSCVFTPPRDLDVWKKLNRSPPDPEKGQTDDEADREAQSRKCSKHRAHGKNADHDHNGMRQFGNILTKSYGWTKDTFVLDTARRGTRLKES